MTRVRTTAVGAALMLPIILPAWGAEGASTEYIGGYTGFAAGYVPSDPGTYFSNYLYFYSASTSVVPVNGHPALDVSTDVYFEIAQFTWVTKYQLLGGNYGFGIGVPLGYVSVDVGVPPIGVDESTSAFGFGDAILVPALVAWHSGNFHSNSRSACLLRRASTTRITHSISQSISGRSTPATPGATSPRPALISLEPSVTRSTSRIRPRTTRVVMSFTSTWQS